MPFSTRVRSDAGAMATLNEFFRLCDAGGPRCAFSGDAAARFAALARQLRNEPVEIVYDDGTSELVDYTILDRERARSDVRLVHLARLRAVARRRRRRHVRAHGSARTQRFRYERRLPYLTPTASPTQG